MSDQRIHELDQLHHDWEGVHTRLRQLEQRLSQAIALYARGRGPRPISLIAEVEALRAECAQKFQALMAGVKAGSAE